MNRHKSVSSYLILALITALVSLTYLAVSNSTLGIGFPLDDAWIHQTYARNFGEWGEWAFFRGQVSAGSTSPLWTVILAVGYYLRFNPFFWTFLCGGIALFGTAVVASHLARPDSKSIGNFPWFGLLLIGEWHMVWSSLSGMETILFAALILVVFFLAAPKKINYFLIGFIIGLSVWIRPDGLTLLGPVSLVVMTQTISGREKCRSFIKICAAFLVIFLPYLIFNFTFAGTIWPNTFFAKQMEYVSLQQIPFIQRTVSLLALPLVGIGIFLFPGFIYACYYFCRHRIWWGVGAILWWLGFTLVYVWRLPVEYQHGRYLIPSMPVFWLIGWIGSSILLKKIFSLGRLGRLVRFGSITAAAVIWISFLILGAKTYANDVGIINSEMIETAQWISLNTPEYALIGAHDIGALGYFGKRKIVDLAGLISPEVIPFIRDEQKLLDHLIKLNANYLVTFPGWYPWICSDLPVIFQTRGSFSPAAGGENMAVYQLQE